MKNSYAVIAIIVVAIIVGSGVYAFTASSSPSSTSSTTSGVTNITVSVVPADDTIPLYIAQQKGYFAQYGLNVTIKVMGSPSLEEDALASGAVQISLGSVPSAMAAYEQGFDFPFIIPATVVEYPAGSTVGTYLPPVNDTVVSPHAIVVLKSSGITSLTQLPGHSLGMSSIPIEVGLDEVLGQLGYNGSQVNYQIISYPNLLTALEQKRVDAVSLIQPFTTEMILANQSGATAGQFRIIGDDENFANSMIAGWMASPIWANANPTLVNGFIKAIQEGIAAVPSNSALVQQYLTSYLKMDPQVAAQMPLPYFYSSTTMPYAYMQNQISAGIQHGIYKATDNATQLVNPNFLTLTSP